MRTANFAKRSFKEIIRDPLSVTFALMLPLFLLFIFQQFEIPSEAYKIENFTPGIIVFGQAFVTMFTAVLVAKDRSGSLLARLGVSPMRGYDYVGGYALALIPVVLMQSLLFFAAAIALGLDFSAGILLAIPASVGISLLFIASGILIGSVTSEKAASGVASIIVQLVAFTSGMYFEGDMIGGFFAKLCDILPFQAAVNLLKMLINPDFVPKLGTLPTLAVFAVYTAFTAFASCLVFRGRR